MRSWVVGVLSAALPSLAGADVVQIWNLCPSAAEVYVGLDEWDSGYSQLGPFSIEAFDSKPIETGLNLSGEADVVVGLFAVVAVNSGHYLVRDVSGKYSYKVGYDGEQYSLLPSDEQIYLHRGLQLRVICHDEFRLERAVLARRIASDVKHSYKPSIPVLSGPSGSSSNRIASIPNGSSPVYVNECTDYTLMGGQGETYCEIEYGDIKGWTPQKYLGELRPVQ